MSESVSRKSWLKSLVAVFDTHASDPAANCPPEMLRRIDLVRVMPFFILHLGCFAVIWTGFSWWALGVAVVLYVVRMFAITGGYHRCLAHRSVHVNRAMQFVFAVLGNASAQRGPLWWAAHHRLHHRNSDEAADAHSPTQCGFWWSHCGWFLSRKHYRTHLEVIPDLAKCPELMFLDRFDALVPILLLGAMYGLGEGLRAVGADTTGLQMVTWGFCISTVAVAHATFTINSLAHTWGKRRFETTDTSRNNFILALLTLGEGWHNNHHHYQSCARQGFYWWEVDITWYALWLMQRVGLVRHLVPLPAKAREP